jgi:hypothetical protein
MKTLALHILDIGHNSVSAGAGTLEIELWYNSPAKLILLSFTDDGKGMSEEQKNAAADPYFTSRTTRKVGMGLPLLKHTAMQCGGDLDIQSEEGKGTKVSVCLRSEHIDLPPLGDLPGVILMLATAKKGMRLIYKHITDLGTYVFDSHEVQQALGEIKLNDPMIAADIREMIQANIEEITPQ